MKPAWSAEAQRVLRPRRPRRAAAGFTLIDVLALMVLVAIVGMSLMANFGKLAQDSAMGARLRTTQALAQGLLDEIAALPFTYCDADDPRVRLATGAFVGGAGCQLRVDVLGPEPGETRYNAANRFDNISDYNGFAMPGPGCAGICSRDGQRLDPIGSPLQGCSTNAAVQAVAMPGIAALDANGRPQAVMVQVQAACGDIRTLVQAVRTRHAPNRP